MSDKKPREFWIKGATAHEFEVVNSMRVIEISAYEKAIDMLEKVSATLVIHSKYSTGVILGKATLSNMFKEVNKLLTELGVIDEN